MIWLIVFVGELVTLSILARWMFVEISRMLQRVVRSRRVVIYLLSLVFLPGTMLHEFAHLITAVILGVRTGKFSVWPALDTGESIKMGSVQIAKSDPVRRAIIGAAPFLIGVSVMLILLWWLTGRGLNYWWEYALTGVVLFEIGNTMFSSRRDMEGTMELLLALGIIGGLVTAALWRMGVMINVARIALPEELLQKVAYLMLFPLGIDVVVLALVRRINRIGRRI